MSTLADAGRRLLRALLGGPRGESPVSGPGLRAALDGATAVAVAESCLSQAAAVGASGPGRRAELSWREEVLHSSTNLLDQTLRTLPTPDPRGTLAAACGMSAGGLRATAFLSGPDLGAARDLMDLAAGRRLPLVVHVFSRAAARHAVPRGTGHEYLSALTDTGWVQFYARNAAEAVDLALVGRMVAERALCPVLVAMDGEETAASVQDVELPTAERVRALLGSPEDRVEVASPAQQMLFGDHRRRIPRWHDLERPVLLGARHLPDTWALGAAAGEVFFEETIREAMATSFERFHEVTGRERSPLWTTGGARTDRALVLLGSAAETAGAVAAHLHGEEGIRVRVVAPVSLEPFPAAEMVRALSGHDLVWVMERQAGGLSGETPLLRAIRGALDRAAENARFGEGTHPGIPSLSEGDRPRLLPARYGLGGQGVRPADVAALCRSPAPVADHPRYVGLSFQANALGFPQRQAAIDTLNRRFPALSERGLRSEERLDVRAAGSLTVSVQRMVGQGDEPLARALAVTLHELKEGQVRTRTGMGWDRWDAPREDRLTWSPTRIEPGEDVPPDVVVVDADPPGRVDRVFPGIATRGAAVLVHRSHGVEPQDRLGPRTRASMEASQARLYALPEPEVSSPDHVREAVLGGIFGVISRLGRIGIKTRRLVSAREAVLRTQDVPDLDARLDAFEKGLEQVETEGIAVVTDRDAPAPIVPMLPGEGSQPEDPGQRLPLVVRHLQLDHDAASTGSFDAVQRYWHVVGLPARYGRLRDLVPDPHLALGAVPPLASTFRDLSPGREHLPVYCPRYCTGCGDCWRVCPEGAVGALALRPRALMEQAMGRAVERGAEVEPLRPLLGKWIPRISRALEESDPPAGSLGPVLEPTIGWLLERLPGDEARREQVQQAFEALRPELESLPVAITAPFHGEPEAAEKGTGEWLVLSIDPDTCKACGACTSVCETGALEMVPETPEVLHRAREIRTRWEHLPDTAGQTVQRVRDPAGVGLLSAVLLSRSCLMAMAGGDGAEPGSGEKQALRYVLALTEYALQPETQRFLATVDRLHERVREQVRQALSSGLPAGDLERLAWRLDGLRGESASLEAILEGFEPGFQEERVDLPRVRSLVDLAQGLGNLRWRLAVGPSGLGRARAGLVVAPGNVATWAGAFPGNPFQYPTFLAATGSTVDVATGLLRANLEAVIADYRLVRDARRALDDSRRTEREEQAHRALDWSTLQEEEQRAVPPAVMVVNEENLLREDMAQLAAAVEAGVPLKVVILTTLDFGLGRNRVPSLEETSEGLVSEVTLLGLAQRGATVVQGSIGLPEHLGQSVLAAIRHPGPAIVRIHAPSPQRHGFPPYQAAEQARRAVRSRAFPLFRFDPSAEGVFGTCLDLSANPALNDPWVKDDDRVLTVAHWAATEPRFSHHLPPWRESHGDPTPVHAYLELPPYSRPGRVPVVEGGRTQENGRRVVSAEMLDRVRERARTWRILQELAGVVTPFTRRIREEMEREFSEAHDAEIASLEEEHNAELENLRARLESEVVDRVREGLVTLAGFGGAARSALPPDQGE